MLKLQPIRILACALLVGSVSLQAQMHRVEAPEKVTRAVGVYEWTGDLAKPTAARLVPVSVFIDGQFEDGGTYYSRPIPLTLLNGNIYSLEKAGVPQGNITLDYARHLQTAADGSDDTNDIGWFGYGTFSPLPVARKTRALHASSQPSAIISSNDPDRPSFVRRNPSNSAGKTPDDTTASNDSAPDDPDRPHFSKAPTPSTPPPDPSDSKSTPTPPASTSATTSASNRASTRDDSGDPANDSDRPTLRHRDPKQAEADRKAHALSSVTAIGSPGDDPDRPNMRRGQTAAVGAAAPQLTGIPVNLHQMIAVSDPANREPHPFAREWATPDERANTLVRLEAMARQQLAAYDHANGVSQFAAPPPAPKSSAGGHRYAIPRMPSAVTLVAPLGNEEVTPYTLSYGGLPTFVYTASSLPVQPSAAAPALPERYLTLVAQRLPSGEIQLAFSSVTDAAHLDRTPWFRLIDAVDPDAGHRASLLFELRSQSSRQFALYRILSATADQIFITNPTE